jgi:hypothetical protein
MASAHASNPQSWNRYAYTLNNPLRFVDANGMDVPEACAKDNSCPIVVKVNVIYDKTVNNGKGLTKEQKEKFEQGQMAKAEKDYGNSNIKLDVHYTAGSYTVDKETGTANITGMRSDSLNIMVSSGTPNGANGVSSVDQGVALTFININDARNSNAFPLWTNTTEHEIAHQLSGDVYQNPNPFQYEMREFGIDYEVGRQAAGSSQQDFRQGVEHRQYAVPATPEAHKPQK